MTTYARLSALDRSFLDLEDSNTHMHVGATCVFEAGPLRSAAGGIDIDRVRSYVESRLHLFPRYRQRLAMTPLERHPVWIDDEHFDIRYHVRHLSLPQPGNDRELKRLAGWINSQQLDRAKPLWEIWVIEGLGHDRFAVVAKTHHCMIDGLAGADLLSVMLRPGVVNEIPEPPAWRPRPAPAATRLLWDATLRRLIVPLRSARDMAGHPFTAWNRATDLASSLIDTTAATFRSGSATPINQPVGSHRRFDWLRFDLERVKAVKNRLGGTINDIVLTVVTGGIRRYLAHCDVAMDTGFVFRTLCPVGLHTSRRSGIGGNFLSTMLAELPVTESDPLRQLGRIRAFTRGRKGGAPVRGTEVLEALSDEIFPSLLGLIASTVEGSIAYNLIVTNIPGPPFPLYLLGSRMTASYPLVPLFGHQGVGIALLSYDRQLFWGFNADRDLVPDLHDFVEGMSLSFARLCTLAGLPLADDARTAAKPPGAAATAGDATAWDVPDVAAGAPIAGGAAFAVPGAIPAV